MFTTVLISALGLIIYSILSTDTVLGAKNSAMNTAHQQARTAMLQMLQDLHSAVSLPYLVDANRNPMPTPAPGASASPAPGIAFQQWSMGPLKIIQDTAALPNEPKLHPYCAAKQFVSKSYSGPAINRSYPPD